METFILIFHVVIASVMILFILMQQGKGAEAGASFGGGGSQTVFGSAGSASFLTKLTAGLAVVFFATSMTLAVFAKQHITQGGLLPAPATPVETVKQPVNPDLPTTTPAAQPAAAPAQNSAAETSNSVKDTVE